MDICLRVDSPPAGNQRVRAFTDRRRGLHAETAQSALTVIFRSVIGGLASVRPCLFDVQLIFSSGLPRWLSGKESASHAGDRGSIPGSGRSPGGGNSNSLQYSCLKSPMDRGAWRATVHRVAGSQTRLKPLSTAVSYKVHLFPFLGGQFSELSWVQSCHRAVNFSPWCFSIDKTARRTWLRI